MTDRQKRLGRLVSLREQEHLRSIVGLQQAHRELARVEQHIETRTEQARHCSEEQRVALTCDQHDLWLLSRAEGELCQLEMSRALQQQHAVALRVSDALQNELESRRALRQMNHVMERVHQETIAIQIKKEQQQLDEMARLRRSMGNVMLP